jgi:hypothetical protein
VSENYVASTRADVDVLVSRLKGTYAPARAGRIGAAVKAVFLGLVVPVFILTALEREPGDTWVAVLLAAGSVALAIQLLLEDTAIYSVGEAAFARRNIVPLGNWSVPLADIHTIDFDDGGQAMVITTVTDRKRRFRLRKQAQDNLAALYPEYFGESRPVDYSTLQPHERHDLSTHYSRVLKKSAALTVLGVCAVALDLSLSNTPMHPLLRIVLNLAAYAGAAAVLLGAVGVLWAWASGRAVAGQSSRSIRVTVYGILVAILTISVAAVVWSYA